MGFFSWKCSKTKVSIPHDYSGDIILVTPKGAYRGTYDGYGRLSTKEGVINIMPQVGEDTGILKKGEDMMTDAWTVIDKDGREYSLGSDFASFAAPIKDRNNGTEFFEGRDVNALIQSGEVTRKISLFRKIDKEIKIVVGYEFNGVVDTFETLASSESCEYQGFFYPEDFESYPTDYDPNAKQGAVL